MRVEGGVRHFVAGETGLAVGKRIAGDEAVKPAQFAFAALRVAGAAIFYCAVSAGQLGQPGPPAAVPTWMRS